MRIILSLWRLGGYAPDTMGLPTESINSMDLTITPYAYIPTPKFGQDRAPIEQQWKEWKRLVGEVYKAFEFLVKIQERSWTDQTEFRSCLRLGSKAISEKYQMMTPGRPEAVTEACRRLLLFMDGDPSIDKYGMTPWEAQILL